MSYEVEQEICAQKGSVEIFTLKKSTKLRRSKNKYTEEGQSNYRNNLL